MITRPQDLMPQRMIEELIRLARLDRRWFRWKFTGRQDGSGRNEYAGRLADGVTTWLRHFWQNGADGFGMWAGSWWLVDGPKIFRPTPGQCVALENVEINVELGEYAQPYPAVLVDFPDDRYAPFCCCLCHHDHDAPPILTTQLLSRDHEHDIVTTIATDGRPIEESVKRYDGNLLYLQQVAGKVIRVALNSCLALVNYGCTRRLLYPNEVARDNSIRAKKAGTPAARSAGDRVATAPSILTFSQDVVLHDTRYEPHEHGEPSGREVKTHWRRGHWRMQPHGPNKVLRKRILIKPILIRADKFLGDAADTKVVLHT